MLRTGSARTIGEMSQTKLRSRRVFRPLNQGTRIGLEFDVTAEVMVPRRTIEGSRSFSRAPSALLPLIWRDLI